MSEALKPLIVGHMGWDRTRLAAGATPIQSPGGSLLHCAASFALFHAPATLAGFADRTAFARELALLEARGLNAESVLDRPDAYRFAMEYDLRTSQELLAIEVSANVSPGEIADLCRNLVSRASIVHLCPMDAEDTSAVAEQAIRKGIPVSLQVHDMLLMLHPDLYRQVLPECSWVLLSKRELETFWDASFDDAVRCCTQGNTSVGWVVTSADSVTICGTFGVTHFRHERLAHVVDPTGAGDSFAGALVAALSLGVEPPIAARLATGAAALNVMGHSSSRVLATVDAMIRSS